MVAQRIGGLLRSCAEAGPLELVLTCQKHFRDLQRVHLFQYWRHSSENSSGLGQMLWESAISQSALFRKARSKKKRNVLHQMLARVL